MKEKMLWNRIKEKAAKKRNPMKTVRTLVRGALLVIAAFGIFSITMLSTHKRVESADAFGYTIKLWEWTKCKNSAPKEDFFGFLMSTKSGSAYYSAGDSSDGDNVRWLWYNSANNPYISDSQKFITKGRYGAPRFVYRGTDSDNASSPKFEIHAYTLSDTWSSKKYVGNSSDYVRINKDRDDDWTIMGNDQSKNKSGVNVTSGKFILFENISWSSDFMAYTNGGTRLSGTKDSGWSKAEEFLLYSGKEITYSAMGDYTIKNDQVLRVQGNVFLLDDKTLTIEEGGVLSIEGTFFTNGTIINKGTIIVQENAVLMPFEPRKKAAEIDIRDGGCMIISNNARVYCGNPKSRINATQDAYLRMNNGTILNYGFLVAANIDLKKNSTIENHSTGIMYLGYCLNKDVVSIQSKTLSGFKPSNFGLEEKGRTSIDGVDFRIYDGSKLQIHVDGTRHNNNFYEYDTNGKCTLTVRQY